MSQTVTVRLPDATRAALNATAAQQGLPPGTLAATLIATGLDDDIQTGRNDGDVVSAVLEVFVAAVDAEAAIRRAIAVSLARQIEHGGPGAPGAAARLIGMLRTEDTDEKWAPFRAWLSTPVPVHCGRCSATIEYGAGAGEEST